jgi:hypothetical protein
MLLKDRIVDFAKDFFTKGILQLNPTKFLIAQHFFMDFYLIILLSGAKIFGIVTLVTLVDRYLPNDDGFHEQMYSMLHLCYFLSKKY